jgi:hypothetical protein
MTSEDWIDLFKCQLLSETVKRFYTVPDIYMEYVAWCDENDIDDEPLVWLLGKLNRDTDFESVKANGRVYWRIAFPYP